jgi:hypothetical protein
MWVLMLSLFVVPARAWVIFRIQVDIHEIQINIYFFERFAGKEAEKRRDNMEDRVTSLTKDMILLYSLLGPLVLFAVFVALDWIGRQKDSAAINSTNQTNHKKDPALWSGRQVNDFLDQV